MQNFESTMQSDASGRKDKLTKDTENQFAKIPSDVFFYASLVSMAVSLALKIAGKNSNALFVGQRTAPFYC